jgi:hypothetical protein
VLEANEFVAVTSSATASLADAVFGATGRTASTNAGNEGLFAAVAVLGTAACFAGVAMASPAVCTVASAVTVVSTVISAVAAGAVTAVPDVVAAGISAEPFFNSVDVALGAAAAEEATVEEVAVEEVAAMAAAAMASGADLAEADVATATLAGATATGIATATAFGVITRLAPSSCAAADGSVAEVPSEESFPADFVDPALTLVDFPSGLVMDGAAAGDDTLVLPLELAPALDSAAWLALAPLALFAPPFGAAWSVEAAPRKDPLSLFAELSSAGRCGAARPEGCTGAGNGPCEGAGSLPALAAALLSTNAAKLSFDCGRSGGRVFCAVVCTDRLAARSAVTLNKARPFAMNCPLAFSKDRASWTLK